MKHIHPIEPIAVIALIFALWWYRKKQKDAAGPPPKPIDRGAATRAVAEQAVAAARAAKPQDPPEVVFANFRRRAIETSPQSLGAAGAVADDQPYGALMEMEIADSAVTLACFADGDAGLYYQSGGGIRGGGAHEPVRVAAKEFIALAGKLLPTMQPMAEYPLPGPGRVQFLVLTPRGVQGAEMARESLLEGGGGYAKLFYAAQEVVTRMREIQALREAGAAAAPGTGEAPSAPAS